MRKLAIPIFVLGLAVSLCGIAWAATGPGDTPPAPATDKTAAQPAANLPDAPTPAATAAPAAAPATPAIESELAELRALLHAQAAEIEAQRKELADLKAKLGDVKDEAVDAAVSAAVPAATAAVSAAVPSNVLTGGDPSNPDESPMAIHFKGITLTPGGFTAAETVYRNRALSADINTPFQNMNTVFAASDTGHISEFNFSGRQSRITLKLDGKLKSATIGAYYEGDFLGAGSTSNNNESNSYVFRQRQAWGSIWLDNGWFISGGQMWSLVTEQKNGLENRLASGGENANVPLTIDAQYTIGLSWARQYGFRIVDRFFDKKLSLGLSVEGAATRFTATNANGNFFAQDVGQPGGTYNFVGGTPTNALAATNNVTSQNYALNATPDFVFKAAIDPGEWGHFEILGLVRTFRDRIYPCGGESALATAMLIAYAECPTPLTAADETLFARNDTKAGGGGAINGRIHVFHKKLDLGVHALYGDGVGRYGTGQLNDVTVNPYGSLVPIHGGQGLGTIEWHPVPRLDIYAYGGGEYDARTYFSEPAGITATNFVGYGIPTISDSGCTADVEVAPASAGSAGNLPNTAGSCSGQTRAIFEGTIGFWHRVWQGDRGRIQWGAQYSYVELNAWSGSTGAATPGAQHHPSANDSMFFTSFRYYLP